ncbi:MAG: hypothetical protein ABIH38_05885 [Patescibacteria group bacterium]
MTNGEKGEREFIPNQETKKGKMNAVAAEEKFKNEGAENCVVIDSTDNLSFDEVIAFAGKNRAVIADHDEAGDDKFIVQFPGQEQNAYTQDQLSVEFRDKEDDE